MAVHLKACKIIDPQMEAHYSFKSIRPSAGARGRISTTTFHDHDFYELFLIVYGRIWHLVNNAENLLPAGSLVFIRPRDCHSFRQHQSEDCGLINVAFPKETIAALFAYLGAGFRSERLLEPDLPPGVLLAEKDRKRVASRLARLNNIPRSEKGKIRTQLRLLLVDLLGWHLGKDNFAREAEAQHWLHILCAQMQESENLRGGVPRMQALAHASPEHLSRTFRKELGCTPTQYVNYLRLTYAANLLAHSDSPVDAISSEVGFNNLSYFYRTFKQQFGMTPAQFRAQKRIQLVP